jgi:diacylglycerol O-acyltransferase
MERLTAQDLSMLWPDDVGWPQDIGALVILGGRSLLGPDGRLPRTLSGTRSKRGWT